MDDEQKIELSDLKKRHFAKLHERIHIKYEQMQRKLEKSRSVDAIPGLSDNCSYTDPDVRDDSSTELDDIFKETENVSQSLEHLVIEEIKHRHDARLIDLNETNYLESELLVNETPTQFNNASFSEDQFFGENFSTASLESLNEIANASDENRTSTSPPPKISLRDRIGSRISAVKERRRRMEQERNMAKEEKKSRDKVEKFILSNTNKQDRFKLSRKVKAATVTIALIEAIGVEIDAPEDRPRLLFCRFKLGSDKYKSKTIKCHSTSEVKWQELFNLNMFEDSLFELSLWDKDSCIGRTTLDLLEIDKEKTHNMKVALEGDGTLAQLFILLTISGTNAINTLESPEDYEYVRQRHALISKEFAWYRFMNKNKDLGGLSVIVHGAKGLISNDYYCVLTLNNARVQTHTEYKSNEPNWMKFFSLNVNDISSILVITVCDEKRSEDVGKISIPLLEIRNGEKVWYALKDPSQRDRAKGTNPRILLEMNVSWNLLRAAIRVINTKEANYLETDDRLQRLVFARNLSRAKVVLNWILSSFQVAKTCFEWESTKSNAIALSIWLPFCWFFKIWMLPLLVLIPFIWYRPPNYYVWKRCFGKGIPTEENSKKDKEEKTSLRNKINNLQDMIQTVQNVIGKFAALGERIKNLFNFTVPFLSLFAMFIILVVGFVMYMVPLSYILMIWGVHKFTRKILRPNRIPNSEILDLLSRVPDDEILLDCQPLPLEEPENHIVK